MSPASAIHLYRKFGFEVIPLPDDCVYDRADIRMQLALSSRPKHPVDG